MQPHFQGGIFFYFAKALHRPAEALAEIQLGELKQRVEIYCKVTDSLLGTREQEIQ